MGYFTTAIRNRLLVVKNQSWDQMIRDFLAGNDSNSIGEICVSDENALKFSAVFACLRVLSETFASAPIAEYRKIDDNERQKTNETGLYDILHNATNEEMSAYNFKEMGMNQVNTGGNFICLRQTNRLNDIIALWPIEWRRVEIKRNENKKLIYKIDGPSGEEYTRDQIFHVPGPTLNGIIGMSPIEYLSQAIRLGLTYEKFSVNFFKNGVLSSGFFKHPGSLSDIAFERLKKDLKNNWQGLLNAGVPIIAEDGLDFVPLTMKLADAELLLSRKFQKEEICGIYRVPLHLIQNLDKATFSNIEQQSLEFIMYTMLPWFKRWEECINCQLLTRKQRDAGYYMEFNMSGLLRGDQKSMAEAFAAGRQWGWLSVNDIRRMLNLNPIPNGNIYLQPMNMVEAGKTMDDQKKALVDQMHKLIEQAGNK